MGLGIETKARFARKGLFRMGLRARDILAEVERETAAFAESRGLSALTHCRRQDGKLLAKLHPGEEPVHFEIREADLHVSARTSSCGPGYHAYICDLLDRLTQACDLVWHFDDEAYLDETGYFHARDFEALQDESLRWLRGLAAAIVERIGAGASIHAVGMPAMDGHPILPDAVMTPLGPRSADWFRVLAATPIEQVHLIGEDWFVWFERHASAPFWRKTGLALAWDAVPWHPPQDAEERASYEQALASFENARRLDKEIALPEAEIGEMRRMLAVTDDDEMPDPAPVGIGYRRQPWRWALRGGWTAQMPGYFCRQENDDASIFFHRDLTVYATALRTPRDAPYDVGRHIEGKGEIVHEIRHGDLSGLVALAETPQEDRGEDDDVFLLSAYVTAPAALLILTISFDDPAVRDLALAIARSLDRKPPSQGE